MDVAELLTSPELRAKIDARMEALVDLWFDQLEDMMKVGTKEEKAYLAKTMFPLLTKVQKESGDEGEEAAGIREETMRMFREAGVNLGPDGN